MKAIHLSFAVMILLVACNTRTATSDLINKGASLPSSFGFGKLNLKVINSAINRKRRTMSTLFGNDLALKIAVTGKKEIHAGELFALVTWKQQADPHWFGANIPGILQSVEEINVAASKQDEPTVDYRRFEGKDLKLSVDSAGESERIAYIIGQRPSVMP